jgi:hypothetical protein
MVLRPPLLYRSSVPNVVRFRRYLDARKSGHEFVPSRRFTFYTTPQSTRPLHHTRYAGMIHTQKVQSYHQGKRRGRTGVRTQVPGILRSTRCLFQKPMCSPLHYTTVDVDKDASTNYNRCSNDRTLFNPHPSRGPAGRCSAEGSRRLLSLSIDELLLFTADFPCVSLQVYIYDRMRHGVCA